MPIILRPDVYDSWIGPAVAVDDARALLGENLGGELTYFRVNRAVNSSRVEGTAMRRAGLKLEPHMAEHRFL